MKKNEFWLEIEDFSKSTEDWKKEYYTEEGVTLAVTAWNSKSKEYMVDGEISCYFPELENLGVIDETEGFMLYEGNSNLEELKNEIIKLGFQVL